MSYQSSVYREQGGEYLVCSSSTAAASGNPGRIQFPVQALGTSQTATAVTLQGLTSLTASTTGPTYTIAAPPRAGLVKYIALASATSAASSVVLAGATTAVQIGITGDNKVTLTSTGASLGLTLVSASTTVWAMCGGSGTVISAAQST